MRARVIAGFGTSSGYDAYTIERAGPPPKVIQRSHGAVAVVHGAAARAATNVLGPGFALAAPVTGVAEPSRTRAILSLMAMK
jgi:pyruvate/2-oxoacid:ferredoxin oxidoreductase alpha subunit